MDWLEAQKAAHANGADGGVGSEPMGELKIEGIYPLAYIQMLANARVKRFAELIGEWPEKSRLTAEGAEDADEPRYQLLLINFKVCA